MDCKGHRRWRQQGAVLIVGLVVLLVLSIFGVTAMQSTVLQERMAGNVRQNSIALQAAEAALQAALTYLEQQTRPPLPTARGTELVWDACTVADAAGLAGEADACGRVATVLSDWQAHPGTATGGIAYAKTDADAEGTDIGDVTGLTVEALPDVYAQPRVYVESRYVPPLDLEDAAAGKGTHYYTVTAVGYGQRDTAIAIVQSTIAKVYRY
jgi:type IV pilus assembly protein PilX